MTATIIPISTGRKFCFDCANGYSNDSGLYCREYDCFIDDETVAQRCSEFETENPMQTQVDHSRTQHPSYHGRPIAPVAPVTVDDVKQYIGSLHTTLFGRSFIVTKEEGLTDAAEWLVEVVRQVQNHGA